MPLSLGFPKWKLSGLAWKSKLPNCLGGACLLLLVLLPPLPSWVPHSPPGPLTAPGALLSGAQGAQLQSRSWGAWQPGPGHTRPSGLSPGFSWSPGPLVASAQQPGLRPGRGQVPEGKDWKESLRSQGPSWKGTLRGTQFTWEWPGSNHLQPPPQGPAPMGDGAQRSSRPCPQGKLGATGKWLGKVCQALSPRYALGLLGLPSCRSKGHGSQEAWCLAGLTLSELGPESRELRDNQTLGPRDL